MQLVRYLYDYITWDCNPIMWQEEYYILVNIVAD